MGFKEDIQTIRFEKIETVHLLSSRNVVGTVEGQADDIFLLPRHVGCVCWRAFLFLRVQKRSDILFIFYKAMTKIVQVSGSGIVMRGLGVNFIQKDEGVMELPPSTLCLPFLFSLPFFSSLLEFLCKRSTEAVAC